MHVCVCVCVFFYFSVGWLKYPQTVHLHQGQTFFLLEMTNSHCSRLFPLVSPLLISSSLYSLNILNLLSVLLSPQLSSSSSKANIAYLRLIHTLVHYRLEHFTFLLNVCQIVSLVWFPTSQTATAALHFSWLHKVYLIKLSSCCSQMIGHS